MQSILILVYKDMNIKLNKDITEQLKADNLKGIHIRDVASISILTSGDYMVDIGGDISKERIKEIEQCLNSWFNSLQSDSDWYGNIDSDWVNVHYTQIGLT